MFNPIYMKDALLTIAFGEEDEGDFAKELKTVRFKPSSQVATWTGLTPDAVYQEASRSTWVADMGFAQDWDEPASLSRLLFDHEGETATFTFRPRSGGAGFEVEVIILPGDIGGDVSAFAEGGVSLPIQGRPTPIAAPEPEEP